MICLSSRQFDSLKTSNLLKHCILTRTTRRELRLCYPQTARSLRNSQQHITICDITCILCLSYEYFVDMQEQRVDQKKKRKKKKVQRLERCHVIIDFKSMVFLFTIKRTFVFQKYFFMLSKFFFQSKFCFFMFKK